MAGSCNWERSSFSNVLDGETAKPPGLAGPGFCLRQLSLLSDVRLAVSPSPATTAKARSRSAIRSSTFSIPTENRISCSVTPIFCRSSARIMACDVMHRNGHKRIHAAQAGREGEQLQGFRKLAGVFSGAVDFKAQHAAAAMHLLHGQARAADVLPGTDSSRCALLGCSARNCATRSAFSF